MEFGLGLISLGRAWGFRARPLPSPVEAHELLSAALGWGVSVFDTAPSYGTSEAITGDFLRQLLPEVRTQITVATKCGEHWDAGAGLPFVDHGYDALVRSIDQSLSRLGRIDLLQVHKSSVNVLRSPELWRAIDYARSAGVGSIGASVSDLETGRLACGLDAVSMIQMPYNSRSRVLEELFALASQRGKQVWTNRPFGMGALLHEERVDPMDAYRFVLNQSFGGAILTGTASVEHLEADLRAFHAACAAHS